MKSTSPERTQRAAEVAQRRNVLCVTSAALCVLCGEVLLGVVGIR